MKREDLMTNIELRPLPDLPRFLEERARNLRDKLQSDTFVTDDGAVHWNSNPHAVIAPSIFREAYAEVPEGQQAAYERYLDAAVADYVQSRREHGYSDEERYEMRAAFGPGETVVDVLTGERIDL
jgi:hypothetical protein